MHELDVSSREHLVPHLEVGLVIAHALKSIALIDIVVQIVLPGVWLKAGQILLGNLLLRLSKGYLLLLHELIVARHHIVFFIILLLLDEHGLLVECGQLIELFKYSISLEGIGHANLFIEVFRHFVQRLWVNGLNDLFVPIYVKPCDAGFVCHNQPGDFFDDHIFWIVLNQLRIFVLIVHVVADSDKLLLPILRLQNNCGNTQNLLLSQILVVRGVGLYVEAHHSWFEIAHRK